MGKQGGGGLARQIRSDALLPPPPLVPPIIRAHCAIRLSTELRYKGGRREGGVVSGTRNNVVPQQEQTTTTKEAKESSCGHTLPTEGLLSANTHGSTCSQRASVGNMTIHWAAGFGTANRILCSPRPTFLISISQNLGSQSGRDRNIIFVIVLE